ncbi:DnaJ family domain-containing protein [Ideonella sp.]|jgi:hypothetical protein|uniref:DnaJ family domain-containing protein n=1 Tax=Ideonella sp. TaxID=1929293 RepID=UPI0037BF2933
MPRLELLEDEIGRKLQEAQQTGELAAAKGYGQPLQHSEGWEQTPDEWRMPFKILKDAGVVPHEVEMMQERALLRTAIDSLPAGADREKALKRLAELEQAIALRLEALRRA